MPFYKENVAFSFNRKKLKRNKTSDVETRDYFFKKVDVRLRPGSLFYRTKLELQCLKNSDSILCHLMGQAYQHIFPSASPISH